MLFGAYKNSYCISVKLFRTIAKTRFYQPSFSAENFFLPNFQIKKHTAVANMIGAQEIPALKMTRSDGVSQK